MTLLSVHRAVWPAAPAASFARVRFFGKIADRCGASLEVAIPTYGCTLADLKTLIGRQVADGELALAEPGLRVAVDQEMTGAGAWVLPGQEVAFLSPFSGG